MENEYASFREVRERFGFAEAVNYKILVLRDKYPLVNNLLSFGVINKVDSSGKNELYDSSWDSKGRLESLFTNSF